MRLIRSSARACVVKLAKLIGVAALVFGQVACAGSTDASLTPIESGAHSNVTERSFQAVVSDAAFRKLYGRLHAHRITRRSVPATDFDNVIVVAAFMGQRSTAGHRIGFADRIVVKDRVATVVVVEAHPLPTSNQAQVITTPFALAALPRGPYEAVAFSNRDGDVIQIRHLPRSDLPAP